MESLLSQYIRKFFRFITPRVPDPIEKPRQPRQSPLPAEGNNYKWLDKMGQKGMDIGIIGFHALMAQKAIYTTIGAEQREGWVVLNNTRDREVKIMPSHYNYDLKAVLNQLPLQSKETAFLQQAERDMKKGLSVKTSLKVGTGYIPVRLEADPIGRAVKIKDSLGRPLSLKSLHITLAPPAQVNHYALYEGQKLVATAPDIWMIEKRLKDELSLAAKGGETKALAVLAMKDNRPPDFDEAGKLVSTHTPVVLEGQSIKSANDTITFQYQRHTEPGDMMTQQEKEMRLAMKQKPFLSDKQVRESFEKLQQRKAPVRLREEPTLRHVYKQQQSQRL